MYSTNAPFHVEGEFNITSLGDTTGISDPGLIHRFVSKHAICSVVYKLGHTYQRTTAHNNIMETRVLAV